jgi:hypothetical protein
MTRYKLCTWCKRFLYFIDQTDVTQRLVGVHWITENKKLHCYEACVIQRDKATIKLKDYPNEW